MQAIFAKIISFFMAILAFLGLVKPETPNDKPGLYEVHGSVITICLDSNPTTGYDWTAVLNGDCVELTRDEYKQDPSEPGMAGVGGYQYYDFTAVRPGTATITFTYARSWETTDADRTITFTVTVDDDLCFCAVDWTEV